MLGACLPHVFVFHVLYKDICVAMNATKLQPAQDVERQMRHNTIQGMIPDAFTA